MTPYVTADEHRVYGSLFDEVRAILGPNATLEQIEAWLDEHADDLDSDVDVDDVDLDDLEFAS